MLVVLLKPMMMIMMAWFWWSDADDDDGDAYVMINCGIGDAIDASADDDFDGLGDGDDGDDDDYDCLSDGDDGLCDGDDGVPCDPWVRVADRDNLASRTTWLGTQHLIIILIIICMMIMMITMMIMMIIMHNLAEAQWADNFSSLFSCWSEVSGNTAI